MTSVSEALQTERELLRSPGPYPFPLTVTIAGVPKQKTQECGRFGQCHIWDYVGLNTNVGLRKARQATMSNLAQRTTRTWCSDTHLDTFTAAHPTNKSRFSVTKKTVQVNSENTRWFKYDRDWFVCKQAAMRSSCATFREWSHNLHPPSCSG